MTDGFDTLIPRANAFFAELRADNTRAFFEAHKDRYLADIRRPAELLADLMAEDIARATGRPHAPKVFRIHRDVRFSKDKTPYATHLHMMWRPATEAPAPAWFFGSAPDYLILGMGIMEFRADALATWRAMIDAEGDRFARAMAGAQAALGARLSDWGPAPLRRVPAPFAPDHPHADLLRLKSFALTADLPEGWARTGLLRTLNAMLPPLQPVWSILRDAFPG